MIKIKSDQTARLVSYGWLADILRSRGIPARKLIKTGGQSIKVSFKEFISVIKRAL
jgi:hypothetical protein